MLSLLHVLFVGRGFEVYAISQHLNALKHGLVKVMCLLKFSAWRPRVSAVLTSAGAPGGGGG